MHQIQRLMSSVQRSQTAMLEVVKLVNAELERRTGHLEQITVPDDFVEQRTPSQLMQQFVVVKSEEEMAKLMWDDLKEGVPAFDVIISPFGCDHEALPQRIRKFIEEDDVVDDLPNRSMTKVSNFSSLSAVAMASNPIAAAASLSAFSPSMCDDELASRFVDRNKSDKNVFALCSASCYFDIFALTHTGRHAAPGCEPQHWRGEDRKSTA